MKLCDGRTVTDLTDAKWTSWAVTTDRMETFWAYQRRGEACGASSVSKPPLLAVSNADTRLSIYGTEESGYRSCANEADALHKSVIVISTTRNLH